MQNQSNDRTKPIEYRKNSVLFAWVLGVVVILICLFCFIQNFALGLIVSIVAFFVFRPMVESFQRNAQDAKLQQNGVRAMATVTSFQLYRSIRHRVMGELKSQMYSAKLELEVHPSDRPKYTAKTIGVFSKTAYRDLAPGLVLTVVFDPSDPQKVAIADTQ